MYIYFSLSHSPLLGVLLRLLLHHAALLAAVELLVGLGDIEELEDAVPAVYGCELARRVPVDVQRPDVTAELDEEADAELVAARRGQMERRVAEVVGFVRVASVGYQSFVCRVTEEIFIHVFYIFCGDCGEKVYV